MKIFKKDSLLILSKEYKQKSLKELLYIHLNTSKIDMLQKHLNEFGLFRFEVLINDSNYRSYDVSSIKVLGIKSKNTNEEKIIYKVKLIDPKLTVNEYPS